MIGYLVDFTPTMLELSESEKPAELSGHSLVPVLKGEKVERPWPIFWQFGSSRAIRDRDWKLVKQGNAEWELYQVSDDPTELNDIASGTPDRVKQMIAAWEAWWADKGAAR